MIPTPAAAPAPTYLLSTTPDVTPQTGRIRVLGAPEITYISRSLDSKWGNFLTCTNESEALRVRFTPSEKPHGIEVLVGLGSRTNAGL